VRWLEDRREHFIATVHAREQLHDLELAADRDGRLLGLRDRMLLDLGAYNPSNMINAYNTVAHMFGMYQVPAARWEVAGLLTNKTPHAPYRGAGRPEAVYAMERLLERLAQTLDLDPAEVRRRNLVPAEAMPYATGVLYRDGQPVVYDSGDYPRLFERALELLDYDGWRARQQRQRGSTRLIGIGLASYIEGTGVGPFESGSVTVDPSGQVRVATGSCSQGQGHATTFAQIVADALGVPLERIEVVGGDTATLPYGFGTVASRSLVVGGTAVAQAADRVAAKAIRVGAQLLEAAPDDLTLSEGLLQVRGAPERSLGLGQIVAALTPALAPRYGEAPGLSEEAYFTPPTVTYASGVHATVLEVDVETGQVEILRYVVVHDCGRVVNPTIADGQVVGGVAQGLGGALFEDLVYDAQGQLLSSSLLDYLLPTSCDLPALVLDHLEFLSTRNPLGVKGLGEGGAVGPPAAVANAVEDALRPFGVVVRETPLGPNQIRALIRGRGRTTALPASS
jgi:carbon-monoxide dehydrogenase large subunit